MAEELARARNARSIAELEIEIGSMAGVELHTLMSALKSSVKSTMLANARIVRHDVGGEGQCADCGAVFPVSSFFQSCPECGGYLVNIVRGKELNIKSIVINR